MYEVLMPDLVALQGLRDELGVYCVQQVGGSYAGWREELVVYCVQQVGGSYAGWREELAVWCMQQAGGGCSGWREELGIGACISWVVALKGGGAI